MAYNKIQQLKLLAVIEQQLEHLILKGSLQPDGKRPPERKFAVKPAIFHSFLREAIQHSEAKGLLLHYQDNLWHSRLEPLSTLIVVNSQSQFILLKIHHVLKSIAVYYAALHAIVQDLQHIRDNYTKLIKTQQSGNHIANAEAVMQYQMAIMAAAHNVVLLHLQRCMVPILQESIKHHLELFYSRQEALEKISNHQANVYSATLTRSPELAREASQHHLAFIQGIYERILLELNRK